MNINAVPNMLSTKLFLKLLLHKINTKIVCIAYVCMYVANQRYISRDHVITMTITILTLFLTTTKFKLKCFFEKMTLVTLY